MRSLLLRHTKGPIVMGFLLLALGACRDATSDPTGVEPPELSAAKAPTDPMSKVNRLPPELEQKVRALRADMEAQGYQVARGYWTLWGPDECKFPLRTVGFCYGNNPVAPYPIAVVPRWRDEFIDQSLHHAILAPQRNMAPNYRLAEREALVVVAQMPPQARYFGIQTNVFTRETAFNPNDPVFQLVQDLGVDPKLVSILFAASPNPARRMLIASIGNSINNVVIEEQAGTAFGQQRYFVITPDESMATAVTAALGRAGVPSSHVFTEPVSPELVRLGLGPEADDLITYMRFAMPENEVLGEAWRERLPVTVLRIRDTDAAATSPFPLPAYEARSWNLDEEAHLKGALGALVAAVKTEWQQPSATALPFFSAYRFFDLVGQHCLGNSADPLRGPMNCLGDTQDADYQLSPSLRIDDGQVIALVGTLATETGNATYTSLSINRFPALVGVLNISDPALQGTAAGFGGFQTHDPFYVYYLARDCTGLYPACLQISTRLVGVGETLKVIQRNYVAPGSRRGPDPVKLLNPVVIVLDGRGARPASR